MPITLDGSEGIENDATDLSYTGTLTGGTGVVNLGSGQLYKDAAGNVGIGTSTPECALDVAGQIAGKFEDVGTNPTALNLAVNKASKLTVTAAITITTTVPPAGATAYVIIENGDSTNRVITFGTGFATTGTLSTGFVSSGRRFVVSFVSDGTRLIESSRTASSVI